MYNPKYVTKANARPTVNVEALSPAKVEPSGGRKQQQWKSSKRFQYIPWEFEETACLIRNVRLFFENKEHQEAKMWQRVKEKSGEGILASRTPQDLRTKWRSLKKTARTPKEARRGANMHISEEVLAEVVEISTNLEAKARRGKAKQ